MSMAHPVIYLDPHCEECNPRTVEITWCNDDVYDNCEVCGKPPVKYVPTTKWTRIEEGSYPPVNTFILVYTEGVKGSCRVASWRAGGLHHDEQPWHDEPATHWQPVPRIPGP